MKRRFSEGALRGAAWGAAVALLLALGCGVRVTLGVVPEGDGGGDAGTTEVAALDGGGAEDGGARAFDGGAAAGDGGADGGPPISISQLRVAPAVASVGQPSLTLSFRVDDVLGVEFTRLESLFSVDGTTPSAAGFSLAPAGENATSLRPGEFALQRFAVALRNEAGTVAASLGRHELCARVTAFAQVRPSPGGAVQEVPLPLLASPACTTLEVQQPASLSALVKGPRGVVRGEVGTFLVSLSNAGQASAVDLAVESRALLATSEEPAPGLVAGPVRAAPLLPLPAHASRDVEHRVSVDADAPLGRRRFVATVSGRDGNDPARPLGAVAAPVDFEVRGLADVAVRLRSTPASAEAGAPVRVTVELDNGAGLSDGLVDGVSLRFSMARSGGVSAWSVAPLGEAPTFPLRVPAGERRELAFVATAATGLAAPLGENLADAETRYHTEGSAREVALAHASAPATVMVLPPGQPALFAVGPGDGSGEGFGSALAFLGSAAPGAANWPTLAVGAPLALGEGGAVHFFQTVVDGAGSARLEAAARVSGVGRLGGSLGAVGNWSRTSPFDLSAEVALGQPGLERFLLYDLALPGAVGEALPSTYAPCDGCGGAAALAGNLQGRRALAGETLLGADRRLLAVGAPDAPGGGRVDLFRERFSAEPGGAALLHRVLVGAGRYGAALAVGDLDGDGEPDLLVGAPSASEGARAAGAVHALRGPAFVEALWTAPAQGVETGEEFGATVAVLGDVDGDGYPEVLVGAPGAGGGRGRVLLVSGQSGARLYSLEGRAWPVRGPDGVSRTVGERFGSALAPLFREVPGFAEPVTRVDFNGDHQPDFAVGAPEAAPGGLARQGAAYVFTTRDGATGPELLLRHDGTSEGERLGAALSTAGDVDGDGFEDLAIGSPGYRAAGDVGPLRSGALRVVRGLPLHAAVSPPELVVTDFDAGTPLGGGARTVSLGQRRVPVWVALRNAGDRLATSVLPRLLLRRGAAGDGGPVPTTSLGCADAAPAPVPAPALARVCDDGPPVLLPARGALTVTYHVDLAEGAPEEDWQLSFSAGADEGGLLELGASERRTWRLQRPAALAVALRALAGNTDLGYLSLNPGCPVELGVLLTNPGGATLRAPEVSVHVTGAGALAQGVQVTRLEEPPAQLAGGASVTVRFRLEALLGAPRTLVEEGAPLLAQARADGLDANSGAPLSALPPPAVGLRLVESRAHLLVMALASDLPVVTPGQLAVPLRLRLLYEYDALLEPYAEAYDLTVRTVTIEPIREGASVWPARLVPTASPPVVRMCTHASTVANPCFLEEVLVSVDVPAATPPGLVRLGASVLAFERGAGEGGVLACSDGAASETLLLPVVGP